MAAEEQDELRVVVLPPPEALDRGQRLPRRSELVMTGVSDGEWVALETALAEA